MLYDYKIKKSVFDSDAFKILYLTGQISGRKGREENGTGAGYLRIGLIGDSGHSVINQCSSFLKDLVLEI